MKGPGYDFMNFPRGNMKLAAEYMKKAGYPSGKYTGSDELLMAAANADPGKAQAEVARAQIEKLGFKVKFRVIPQDVVYNEYCQVPAQEGRRSAARRAGSRTSPIRSRCSSRRSRARRSSRTVA